MHQASPMLERSHLQQRFQRAVFEEPELLIDPDFFQALRSHFPQIQDVQIQLTRGHASNEMTRFRYNVLLHKATHDGEAGEKQPLAAMNLDIPTWDWTNELTVAVIHQHLAEVQPEMFILRGVPNARVMGAVQAAAWLSEAEELKTVGQMRAALEHGVEPGIDPEAWWSLEQELPYHVTVSWSAVDVDRYDVLLQHQEAKRQKQEFEVIAPVRPWHSYANQPLKTQVARRLGPQLRRYLEQKLPDYMVPAAFVVLETFPLTPNGKIDRRALPTPIPMESARGYVAPRSPIESRLVSIWSELLGVKQVGIHDNFFELGGHSLLATQMTSRIRDTFEVELPLRHLFEAPTIAQLAQQIDHLQVHQPQSSIPAIVPLSREAHRRSRSSLNQQGR